jgi:ubiquinone biosynthesis protein
VRAVVEADLGRTLADVFATFDPVPLAAASIAQVHVARLLDGTEVVVKVQRPGIDAVVAEDLATLAWLAPRIAKRNPEAAVANLPAYIELFAETIVEELDFRLEAQNMLDIARVLAAAEQRQVVVPRPHPDLVTRRVLVMERLHGFSTEDEAELAANGVDPGPVYRALMVSFLEGAMIHGVFHGDLHGGNMMVSTGGRPAIFDFGITGRFTEESRLALLGLMFASAAQDGRGVLGHFRTLGGFPPDADIDTLADELDIDGLMARNTSDLAPEDMALQMRETMNRLVAHGAKLPKELFLYIKGMVYLNGAVSALAADVDMFAEMMHIYGVFMERHGGELAKVIDVSLLPDQEGLVSRMREQMGVSDDVDAMTYRELREVNAARQAELREAMRRTR